MSAVIMLVLLGAKEWFFQNKELFVMEDAWPFVHEDHQDHQYQRTTERLNGNGKWLKLIFNYLSNLNL